MNTLLFDHRADQQCDICVLGMTNQQTSYYLTKKMAQLIIFIYLCIIVDHLYLYFMHKINLGKQGISLPSRKNNHYVTSFNLLVYYYEFWL